uniref:Uncharacterized protein n=1 Tax=Arundo donax TaxID=35708 RepID=A0A0A9CFM5_ARUDO
MQPSKNRRLAQPKRRVEGPQTTSRRPCPGP